MSDRTTPLLVERRAHALVLTLNRPRVRNAIDTDLAQRLNAAIDELEAEADLRVAVITGVDGFCSGMDLREFARTSSPPWATANGFAALLKRQLTKPLIAAVERFALAGGCELALMCDLIVAGAGTVLGIPEVKRGLVAAGGALRRLPRALPYQLSAELALLGGTLEVERAHQLGLVNRVTAPGHALEVALELASEIARHRPAAVQLTKQILSRERDWSDGEFWARQQTLVDPLFRDEGSTEGATAFLGGGRSDDAPPEGATAPTTIPDLIRARAAEQPHQVFLRFDDRAYTYADLDAATSAVASSLHQLGVARGARVAVLMRNCPEMLWLLWGIARLGAVAVPLNVEARGDQLSYFLRQSGSAHLAIDAELLEVVGRCQPELSPFENVFLHGAAKDRVADGLGRKVSTVEDLLRTNAPPVDVALGPSDLHALNFTSGTTGPSKAAMSPHGQPVAVARLIAAELGYRKDDVFYTCLPLFHVNALWYTAVTSLWVGGTMVLGRRFSASRFWGDVNAAGATIINLLGAMTNMLAKRDPAAEERTHSVRLALVAPTTPALAELLRDRYGIGMVSLMAATETFPVTILPAREVTPETAGSAGRESRLAEIRIVDASGEPVAPGTPGEIFVRPRQAWTMSMGYWNMPAETVAATDGLWFHTGDRAYLDARGYLFFVDRVKEVIRRRGENISSFEVESVVLKHPEVVEAAAVPVRSEMSEDDVGIFVVRRPGATLTERELIDFCSGAMAKYMVPRFVGWIAELPRTSSQKIEKYKLRALAAESIATLWDRETGGSS